ncbi:MAG: hypothetical protein UHM85_10860 [Acutalibacteraceae bacterium]|nr:hypothetical protein [Acutalibacteraceae bacterium]
MSLSPLLAKIIGLLLAVLTPFLNFFMAVIPGTSADDVSLAMEKTGGYIKGVCHAEPQYELLNEGNIEWFRDDIPFPYNKDGSLSQSYISWKEESKEFAENGIRIFGITPYPEDYIEYGLDPRLPESREAIQDIARFYMEDLRGIVGAFQITNEMGIDRFTYPLTMEEAYEFVGMQLEAMYPIRDDVIIGYNLAALSILDMPIKMSKYHQYCDYVGVDLYLGCFENVLKNADQYITVLNYVSKITRKPVILCEFGYIGLGEPKSEEEKLAILESYGYSSEEEAAADIDNFIKALPPELADEFDRYADETPEYRADLMFNGEFANHLYRELPDGFGLYGFPHTPEGQAEFFSYIIPKIRSLDYVIGSFIYMWDDSGDCYVCGQEDCPVETKWGLVDCDGNPKPAYYAVQEAFAD